MTRIEPEHLWAFLPIGYVVTVLIETPVLLVGLSKSFLLRERLFAGLWLTAVTYPIVILVLPLIIGTRFGEAAYLGVAETFAPVAECLLFRAAFRDRGPLNRSWLRDFAAITVANLLSFAVGYALF